VCQKHLKGLNFVTPAEAASTLEALAEQRRKLQETQKLQLALRQEWRRNDALIRQLRALLSPLSSASSSASSCPAPSASVAAAAASSSSSSSTAMKSENLRRREENEGEEHMLPHGEAFLSPPPLQPPPHASSSGSSSSSTLPANGGGGGEHASPFAFLVADPAARALSIGSAPAGATPLATLASFVVSQLPAVRALLAELQPRLSSLSNAVAAAAAAATPAAAADDDGGSHVDSAENAMSVVGMVPEQIAALPATAAAAAAAQDARLHYIESQARRHLSVTRGLELDEAGAVRDGAWQGAGRSVTTDEVAALERFVGSLKAATGKEVEEEEEEEEEDNKEDID
jgi:hypothetical protein